jgi:uncharacterized protein (TIGR02611 family)
MAAERDDHRIGGPDPGTAAAVAGGAHRAPESEQPAPHRFGSRAPHVIRRSRPLHLTWRVAVFLLGLAVVAGGVLLLPLPGPGWVVIFAGMAVWATEFVWAQRVLAWTRAKVTEAGRRALDPRVRRRNTLITAAIVVVLIGGAVAYVVTYGFDLPWDLV